MKERKKDSQNNSTGHQLLGLELHLQEQGLLQGLWAENYSPVILHTKSRKHSSCLKCFIFEAVLTFKEVREIGVWASSEHNMNGILFQGILFLCD